MKYVYLFGDGKADGQADMKNLLGGKGANLAEMNILGIPVPPGFTLTTEVCTEYYKNNKSFPAGLDQEVKQSLSKVESIMGTKFGDPDNPLLLSVRSGARQSMPGMMETVLNVGLTSHTIPGLIKKTNNPSKFFLPDWVKLRWEDNHPSAKIELLKSLGNGFEGVHHVEWIGSSKDQADFDSNKLIWSAWDYLKNRSQIVGKMKNLT